MYTERILESMGIIYLIYVHRKNNGIYGYYLLIVVDTKKNY